MTPDSSGAAAAAIAAADARRILFSHFGEEWVRGSEIALRDLAVQLQLAGHAVMVWCNARAFADRLREDGVAVVQQSFPILFDYRAPRFDITTYRAVLSRGHQLIEEFRPDVLHANNGAPHQWLVPLGRRFGIPVVGELHNEYVLRDRCTMLLHQASASVGVSESSLVGLRMDGVPADRLHRIVNGVDLDSLRRRAASRPSDIPPNHDGGTTIVGVGSLIARKGFDVALYAMAAIQKHVPTARLLIVGDGPERGALNALCGELRLDGVVTFLGERTDAASIMRHFGDVVIIPSRSEALPLVLLEAGGLDRCVVASAVSGIPEVITDGCDGLLVPPEQPDALASAVTGVLRNDTLRRTLGKALGARIESGFSASARLRSWLAVYRQVTRTKMSVASRLAVRSPTAYIKWVAQSVSGRMQR